MLIRLEHIIQVNTAEGHLEWGIPYAGHYLYYPEAKTIGQSLWRFYTLVKPTHDFNLYTDCFELEPIPECQIK